MKIFKTIVLAALAVAAVDAKGLRGRFGRGEAKTEVAEANVQVSGTEASQASRGGRGRVRRGGEVAVEDAGARGFRGRFGRGEAKTEVAEANVGTEASQPGRGGRGRRDGEDSGEGNHMGGRRGRRDGEDSGEGNHMDGRGRGRGRGSRPGRRGRGEGFPLDKIEACEDDLLITCSLDSFELETLKTQLWEFEEIKELALEDGAKPERPSADMLSMLREVRECLEDVKPFMEPDSACLTAITRTHAGEEGEDDEEEEEEEEDEEEEEEVMKEEEEEEVVDLEGSF